jgi:hypothetical protein
MVAREGVEPPNASLFSVGICCSLNDLRDSGWPPKFLISPQRRDDHGLESRVRELDARALACQSALRSQ